MTMFKHIKYICVLSALYSCSSLAGIEVYGSPEKQVAFKSASELSHHLDNSGLQLLSARSERQVPRVFVSHVPKDLAELSVDQKTRTFIRMILTNILQANDYILQDRAALHAAYADNHLDGEEAKWVEDLSHRYGFEQAPSYEELRKRVDTIPVSLALAQAIDESAWGTSHFAVEGNALFGEHLPPHSKSKKYVQAKGADVKLAAFDTILETCMEYLHNLNTNHAYHHLREMRHDAREIERELNGIELAEALQHYSERGMLYVDDLRSIIRHRDLHELDPTRLQEGQTTVFHIESID
ncbi:glucosaminidase domain-containing protein [Shewanella sp. Isolate11]|uniref:glucosaminidase domain-containing protein n=1 Tax=Shewanella sp. Isolate11 TaxID=2908530 RepID=UPI001EFCCC81|nr:glucosaminidase domain-containing protein [Shewanella sp. Isolate11]MCG9695564.1 glucosaminidase domain-containing protein [Shewanella sp. Isolate11]